MQNLLSPGTRSLSARRAKSTARRRVSRRSKISSTQKHSEVRNGERSFCSRSSILGAFARRGRARRRFRRGRRPRSRLPAARSPTRREPRIAQGKPPRRLVDRAGDAEHVAHQKGAPRHGRLVDRGHRAHAFSDRLRLFGFEPDMEPGTVAEIDHRQVEGLGKVDKADDLVAGIRGPAAAVEKRVRCHDRDRHAVDPREAGDHRTAEHAAHLEKRALVDHRFDDRPHLVDLPRVARDHGEEELVTAFGVVGLRTFRQHLEHRGRQVGEEPAGRLQTPPPQCRPRGRPHRNASGFPSRPIEPVKLLAFQRVHHQ